MIIYLEKNLTYLVEKFLRETYFYTRLYILFKKKNDHDFIEKSCLLI